MIRYIIREGYVDGDCGGKRLVTGAELIAAYRVNPDECLIVPDYDEGISDRSERERWEMLVTLKNIDWNIAINLYPRLDGEYECARQTLGIIGEIPNV